MKLLSEQLPTDVLLDHVAGATNELTWINRWRDLTEISAGVAIGVSSLWLPNIMPALPAELAAIITGYMGSMFANALYQASQAGVYRDAREELDFLHEVVNQRLLEQATRAGGWTVFPDSHLKFLARDIQGEKGLRLLKLMNPNSSQRLDTLRERALNDGAGYNDYVPVGTSQVPRVLSKLVKNRLASCIVEGKEHPYSGHRVWESFNPGFNRTPLGTALLIPRYSDQVRAHGLTWVQRNIVG
ncbi:hypothetical protein A2631_00580 [Candidatus Daviesbacteria bacterium RIFCSPHIGHO2_01_FULL_44_29]|uniref:Uncharacterized protein n=1 Tax=Candidatus Daviesbacteria bacterium RIFCSPHIGHO2_02_FULL_43_12 TaxID=1797776 RepID=A0A1F5KHK7_9BACT|nr:MAG: hypothetical protein A2631_00580 [Candidatus Daviesbacteria bacterium RIFCSPHIGHO2_01_FULL_44_29]OGE39440.1 MAG: hypothetical protein A3E86_01480 [Candidatus Daviesbacteria bacterium RIFCSPHIGHO2_12_FULL_47_45]OGE40339.1 MAG: hypothetical protein A3D25_03080 [Candidatus Daviesbacteria bacterium RIFCSPHIGHO2_02_FULL_43_12]OGE69742.1 MAG: hypothetical protein A3B55_02125 [Candidatus Daviesbacteria bacterium RIFCSPLOWO2_01_FULL_43_15]